MKALLLLVKWWKLLINDSLKPKIKIIIDHPLPNRKPLPCEFWKKILKENLMKNKPNCLKPSCLLSFNPVPPPCFAGKPTPILQSINPLWITPGHAFRSDNSTYVCFHPPRGVESPPSEQEMFSKGFFCNPTVQSVESICNIGWLLAGNKCQTGTVARKRSLFKATLICPQGKPQNQCVEEETGDCQEENPDRRTAWGPDLSFEK